MSERTVAGLLRRVTIVSLITLAASRAGAGTMSITDLGDFRASSLSNAGQVVGEQSYVGGYYDDGNPYLFSRSAVYQNGVFTRITEPGYDSVQGAVISPGGTIAYSLGFHGAAHTQVNGKAYEIGTADNGNLVGGGPYSIPHAVNDAGTVAGESHAYARWNRAFTSYMDQDGKYNPIAMGANGGATSNALAINNQGTVVGWSDVGGQWRNHAFVGGPAGDIGTLGGLNSKALGINDKGQVVGWSTIATDYKPPAQPSSYYDPGAQHAFVYQNGKMTDLGVAAGFQSSQAEAINEKGLAVGQVSNQTLAHAALFDTNSGRVTDLNDLLAPGSGWILKDALDINDSGQIIGTGTFNGADHSFLLSPGTGDIAAVPEPGTLAMFGLVAAACVVRRRRAR